MGRKKKAEPRYLEHKQSGRGRACYSDAAGAYRDVLLPGPFKSEESPAAFGRLLVEQSVAPGGAAVPAADRPSLTTVEVLDPYFRHAERHCRRADGSPTSKLTEVKLVLRVPQEPPLHCWRLVRCGVVQFYARAGPFPDTMKA